MRFVRPAEVYGLFGHSKSTHNNRERAGLVTRFVKIGERASALPDFEIHAISSAKVAGWSDDELRRLVSSLHEFRKTIPGKTDIEIKHGVSQLVGSIRKAS